MCSDVKRFIYFVYRFYLGQFESMDFDILDALDDLGGSVSSLKITANKQRCNLINEDKFACLRWAGAVRTDEEILKAIELGTKSIEYTQLVEWLTNELRVFNRMESRVHALTDTEEDFVPFLLEVSSFLRELNCPYRSLMNGPISRRLQDVQSRKSLLDYLCTELLGARLLYYKRQRRMNAERRNNPERRNSAERRNNMEIEMDSTSTALSLENALKALNIEIDTAEDSTKNSESYLIDMENKITQILESTSLNISPPIISEKLSVTQWESLRKLYEDFLEDYTVRRKLLLTRLEVTVESFKWGEGSKSKENKISDIYLPRKEHLKNEPSVKLSDVAAARESLLVIEKTSSANLVKNTRSSVNKVLISAVPDRGGRPKEQRPPVEMPNWKKRSQDGGRGGFQGGSGQWRGKNKKFHGRGGGSSDKRDKRGGNFDAAGSY